MDPEHLSQRISDLRARLGPPPPNQQAWIESDRAGHYRLTFDQHDIVWNSGAIPPKIKALIS